ncbi:MAG: cupin domain-containing protein [Crenarchaeota archaeon]|nr:MAG: cupin domain-containing protein [Thermoproteota archaeon]
MNENRVFVPKSWGYEDWIVNSPLYCGKLLFIKKEKHTSLHYHKLKTETLYLHSGRLCVTYYDNPQFDRDFLFWDQYLFPWGENPPRQYFGLIQIIMEPGDSFHVPQGRRHTLFGLLDCHLFEFSTEHFDEDSYRVLKGVTTSV